MRWRMWVLVAVAGTVLGSAAAGQPVRYDGHRVLRVNVTTDAELARLLELTDDVWSETVGLGPVDVRVSPEQFERLRASGLEYQLLIADIQPLIDGQYAPAAPLGDPFAAYMRLEDLLQYLDTLVALQPNLASVFVAGQSVEQRDIVGLRISGPGSGPRPAVLYHGGQHAREWITVPVALYVADQLVRKYGIDPNITSLVDRFEWFIIPVMNPDGYVYTWDVDRMWRKNRRNNGNGIFGVDLNRNWGVAWGGVGSEHDPSSDIYCGPAPFSEPETQAIRDWILDHPNLVAYCDLHSYGQLIMYPYGYRSDPPPAPDRPDFEYLAQTMSALVYSIHHKTYQYGPVYTTIYPCSGVSVDWSYLVGNILAFTYELRDTGNYGFLLPPNKIRPNCEEVLPALLFYADYLYRDCNHNGVADSEDIRLGVASDCNHNRTPDECEPGGLTDCNSNNIPDLCDLYAGSSGDCNGNGVPDECDIEAGSLTDCQPNGIPDQCEPSSQADDCVEARPICSGAAYYGSTIGASPDGAAGCGESAGTADVWYYYRPAGGGLLTVSLAGSSYDTVLSIHAGCPGTPANQLACNDDFFGKQSRVQIAVTPGAEYWIRVSGAQGATGSFMLTFTGPPCAEDGDCNNNGVPDECERDCNGNGRPDDCDIASGFSADLDHDGIPDECDIPGDLNCSGGVDGFDIGPFVLALTDPASYSAQFPNCPVTNGDINGDGALDGFDIGPFVQLLVGG